jgi:hypothetical protein
MTLKTFTPTTTNTFAPHLEYDRDYMKAKFPLDNNDNNLYIAINRFVSEEARRERAERERLLAMGIGIVTTTQDRAA